MSNVDVSNDTAGLFAAFAHTPDEHFRLHYFGAVLATIEYASVRVGSQEAAFERFPFLIDYNNQLAQLLEGCSSQEALSRWCQALDAWENGTEVFLPLRALRGLLGVDHLGVLCLLTLGLADEDSRFETVFEFVQGASAAKRLGLAQLREAWRSHLDFGEISALFRHAALFGFLIPAQENAASQDLSPTISATFWEILRGDPAFPKLPGLRYRSQEQLIDASQLLLEEELTQTLDALPALLAQSTARGLIIRGPSHNGRRTFLGALARKMTKGLIEWTPASFADTARWCEIAGLSVVANALPAIVADLAAGDILTLPTEWPSHVPLLLVLGRYGGVAGDYASGLITVRLDLPSPQSRRSHWQRALGGDAAQHVPAHRLPTGHIYRAGQLAHLNAALAGRNVPSADDVRTGLRSLSRQSLDALAKRCPSEGDWTKLCVSDSTLRELHHLESRCRHRERLPALVESTASAGVRALFTGPSGTGKTYAARLLGGCLQKDVYQLDLSSVVNKYIGETEKNLSRVLEAAEDLDVILLLDEGDSLLNARTDVHNANDRYSNLETNFLLQRIESFQGILVITTNARGRIDSAFERRMDVTVEFHPPEAEERWALWQLHIPTTHDIPPPFFEEVAMRCELTGGQIRNAVLHANLLALDNGGVVKPAYLESAVRREYAKLGGVCPLRHFAESI